MLLCMQYSLVNVTYGLGAKVTILSMLSAIRLDARLNMEANDFVKKHEKWIKDEAQFCTSTKYERR